MKSGAVKTVLTGKVGLLALLLAGDPAGATLYVLEADGSGAFATIQEAIAGAADGDVIALNPGRYQGDGNRDIDFLGKAVIVQSAFSNPQSVVIDAEGSAQEPHCGFLFRSGEGRGSVLFGVTVTGGWWEGDPFSFQDGGAIFVDRGCSPWIVCCRIEGNQGGAGGGVFSWLASPRVESCIFVENHAGGGGGMASDGGDPEVVHCVFIENTAQRGGGLALWNTGANVESTVFAINEAVGLGGAVSAIDGHVTLTNCTLYANFGGAIASAFNSHVDLRNSLVCFNWPVHATHCEHSGTIHAQCTNVYGNMLGDWTNCLSGQDGAEGNVCSDPAFCSPNPVRDMDWSIRDDSPCAPDVSGCGLIGAEGVGCYGTPCEQVSWGELKARFR